MSQDLMEYDEDEAVKFIQNYLPQEIKDKYTNDDVNYIIDVIYDFYEDKGIMDENADEDAIVDIDEDEMVAFVLKNTRKDKVADFTEEDIAFIIQAEIAYCESIGMFE